ncbi:MAG: hypothetical protein GX938_06245 [Spirochaetales bacterium]|nr:hypothetical protein [Spirochaetales bacterium]
MNDSDFSGERRAFNDSYENTMAFLEGRQKTRNLSIHDLEGELHHLTIYEGQDWGGRGPLKSAEIQGEISAYITFIDRLKANS